MKAIIGLGRFLLVVLCVISMFGLFVGLANAETAIQEAAIGAVSAAVVIVPYVLLRALAGFGDK